MIKTRQDSELRVWVGTYLEPRNRSLFDRELIVDQAEWATENKYLVEVHMPEEDDDDTATATEESTTHEEREDLGEWRIVGDGYTGDSYICECSKCGNAVWAHKRAGRQWDFCPNCGHKMRKDPPKWKNNDVTFC